jgi:hypothetical protein
VIHQIPKRAQLANLICTRLADLKPQDAVQLRIRAAKLMLSLCGLCEVPRRYRHLTPPPAQHAPPLLSHDMLNGGSDEAAAQHRSSGDG